jgi:TctA family transporter
MIEGLTAGLLLAFSWPTIGYLLLGVFLGMWIGAVPGLGGAVGLALMLPFTFNMDPVPAFALLLGMYAVTSTSDSISSIMLGIPGTVASQATILDGYPLAKKGQAARAFGATYTVSAFGGVVGALLLAASLPIILPFIFAFGVPEFFMLSVLGLTMVGVLSGQSILKGMSVALFGLLLTTIGYANATGVPRFYLGANYLLDGIPIIPIVLGLFGIPELMELAVKNTSISRVSRDDSGDGGMWRGIKDAYVHRWLALRCALLDRKSVV